MDKVDATMNSINEQRDIANEISDAISNTANLGLEIDDVRIDRPEGSFVS
jgi:charged multivesicular body protein 4